MEGGRDVLSVSMTAYFKTSGMSSQNLCSQETQGKRTACETGHLANIHTHLRHTSTYASNYIYMHTKTCKTHTHKHKQYREPIHLIHNQLYTTGDCVNLHKICYCCNSSIL